MQPSTDEELEELRFLYDKWEKVVIPTDLRHLINIELKTTTWLYNKMLNVILANKLITVEKKEELMESFLENLRFSTMGITFIGLELAERMQIIRGSLLDENYLTLRLDFKEYAILDGCIRYTISKFKQKEKMVNKLTTQEQDLYIKLQKIDNTVSSQIRKTSESFPFEQVSEELASASKFHEMMSSTTGKLETELFIDILNKMGEK